MHNLTEILITLVISVFDHVSMFISTLSDASVWSATGSGITFAFAAGALASLPEGILVVVRRWHGAIEDQFSNIDNFVNLIMEHQPAWVIPETLIVPLTANRDQLRTLISKCRTTAGSPADRAIRNTLLKSTVGLCLLQGRIWAYAEFAGGVLTADDVHRLGFLLPGETGGHRSHTEATKVTAEVKVSVVNEDVIHVVVDQSAGENAAQVVHGWPHGVRNALIVIYAADGVTEVYRKFTTHLHNEIRMPANSRGKLFIIKASFLKHIDDEPLFGNAPTFSMPLTTNDLAATLDRQAHEEYEAHVREIERHQMELGIKN
jgi:hypothetical protein